MRYILFLLFAPFTLIAQPDQDSDENLLEKCHTDEMQKALFASNPEIKAEADVYARELESFTKSFSKTQKRSSDDPYIIPVVFHIVHNYGNENISDAQVQDCIRVMNEDFSAQNASVAFVNAAFQDLIADVGIEFRLAQRDVNGDCTNGIVRTVSGLTNSGGENLKSISPIWDRSKYMNVWVCNTIESGAAGYTYYPSSLAGSFGLTNDGIVVRSDYVGAIGTSSAQRSHTMTHEVGHWINLAHLWGSTNSPGSEENCNSDDGVADTPNTRGWTTCNSNGQSCGSLDNVENYMEYSYCGKMFTLGQSARMVAALNSSVASRISLWQPENLIATGVMEEPTICMVDFQADETNVCIGTEVTFNDLSYNLVESRTWIFEGGNPGTSDEQNPVVTYDQPGLYSVSLAASDGSDMLSEVKTNYIRVLDTGTVAIPYVESFENYNVFNNNADENWFTKNLTGTIDWEITDLAAYSGAKSAYVRGFSNDQDALEYLLSKTFDLSEVEGNAVLTFKYAHARRSFNSDDRLRVWISRNCGEHWSLRKTITGDELNSVEGNVTGEFIPQNQSEWRQGEVANIVSVFLNTEFRVRFEFRSRSGNNIYIDDIMIQDGSDITSVNELPVMDKSLQVYPNPTSETVFIDFESDRSMKSNISMMDISGRTVKQIFAGELLQGPNRFEVSCADLPAGLYILRIDAAEGLLTRKLVVN